MKTIKLILAFATAALLAVLLTVSAFAAVDLTNAYFVGETYAGDSAKDALTYEVGETMTFKVTLKSPSSSNPISVPYFSYSIFGDDGVRDSGKVSGEGGVFTYSHKITCPGLVNLTVKALDENGNEINSGVYFKGGAGAEVEKIGVAMAEPDDFDEYWEKCLAELDTVAPTIYNIEKNTDKSDNSYDVYNLYINCVGSKNFLASGDTFVAAMLTVPKDLTSGQAKFRLEFQGAGLFKNPGVNKTPGTVSLNVLAHSVLMWQSSEYYTALETSGQIGGDYLRRQKFNDNADESYFKYMILRDLQALRFLKLYFGSEGGTGTYGDIDVSAWQGLWNGKDVSVTGQSQGGFQSIAVAALDHDVTECNPWVPGWCDMYSNTYYPSRSAFTLVYNHYSQKYFDAAYLGKRIVCKTHVRTGFGDVTCPATGIIAAYNSWTCEKKLTVYQGMEHNCITEYASGVSKAASTFGWQNFSLPYSAVYTFDWQISNVSDASVLQILADGKSVKAVSKGTCTVNFADSSRSPILVEVGTAVRDLIIADSSVSADVVAGMIDAIYTRTGRVAVAGTSWDDFSDEISSGNVIKGVSYYVLSDRSGTLNKTASAMYSAFTSSGAEYLVLVPGSVTSNTTAAMYAMQLQQDTYANAYVCDNGTEGDLAAGRSAGNNIVTIIDNNRPVTDSGYTLYSGETGNKLEDISVIANGEVRTLVLVPSQPYSIATGFDVSAEGLALSDGELITVTGDADGGKIVINGKEFNVLADALGAGSQDGYTWVLNEQGTLTILGSGAISGTYPWSGLASEIKEIDISVGITEIGSGAFANAGALTRITLPYTLTSIQNDAVSGATAYTVCGYESVTSTVASDFAAENGVTFTAIGATGTYKSGAIWNIDSQGTLTITGSGAVDCTVNSSWTAQNVYVVGGNNYHGKIKKVILPEEMTSLTNGAFASLANLKEVVITPNLNTIQHMAFMGCGNLSSIHLAGEPAVEGVADLRYVTSMGNDYYMAGVQNFADVNKIHTFNFSENLKGKFASGFFRNNTVIKLLTIPANVTLSSNFYSNSTAHSIEMTFLGKSTSIPSDLFSGCNITITKIYGYRNSTAQQFASDNGIAFVALDAPAVIASGTYSSGAAWSLDEEGTLTISGTGTVDRTIGDNGGAITGIYTVDGVDYQNQIKKIIIPEGKTLIDKGAFALMKGLQEVVLTPDVVMIQHMAFSLSTALSSIHLAGEPAVEGVADLRYVKSMGNDYYMAGVQNFANVNIHTFNFSEELTGKLGSGFFRSNDKIQSLTIPAGVTELAANFYHRQYVSNTHEIEMTFMGMNTVIPDNFLSGTYVAVSKIYGYVGSTAEAYALANNIPFVDLNASAEPQIIASGTYKSGSTWTLDEEGTLTISGSGAVDCTVDSGWNNMEVYVYEGVNYHSQIKKIIIPEEMTSLTNGAFASLFALEEVVITPNLQTIQHMAFFNCGKLSSVHLAGEDALEGVADLRYVTSMGTDYYMKGVQNFADNNKLHTFNFSKNLTGKFASGFFRNNNVIKSLTIPAGVTLEANFYQNDAAHANEIEMTFLGKDNVIPANLFDGHNVTITKIYGYEGSTAQQFAKDKGIAFEALPPEIIASGTYKSGSTWTLDSEGTLTVSGSGDVDCTVDSGWNNKDVYVADGVNYHNHIKKVIISEDMTSLTNGAFAYLRSLEEVVITPNLKTIQHMAFFSSTGISSIHLAGEEAVEGVADLRYVTSMGNDYYMAGVQNFADVNKIHTFKFSEDLKGKFASGFFRNNNVIKSLTIPAGVTLEANFYQNDAAHANEIEMTFLGKDNVIPANLFEGHNVTVTRIYGYIGSTAEAYAKSKNIAFVPISADGLLDFTGYQVRTEGYNGLRSLYSVNLSNIEKLSGLTVVEYGSLIASEQKLIDAGVALTISKNASNEYVSHSFAVKLPIYQASQKDNGHNGIVANTLGTSTAENGDSILSYACTVTNYSVNTFNKAVRFRGYVVLADDAGNEYILYSDLMKDGADYSVASLDTICDTMLNDGTIDETNFSYQDVRKFREELLK